MGIALLLLKKRLGVVSSALVATHKQPEALAPVRGSTVRLEGSRHLLPWRVSPLSRR